MNWLRERLGPNRARLAIDVGVFIAAAAFLLRPDIVQPKPDEHLLKWLFYWLLVAVSAVTAVITGYNIVAVSTIWLVQNTRLAGTRLARTRLTQVDEHGKFPGVAAAEAAAAQTMEELENVRQSLSVSDRKLSESEGRIAHLEDRVRSQETDNLQLAANVESQRKGAFEWKRQVEHLRNAVDIALTWLYRRQNWGPGLTPDGKHREPAPAATWGDQKYEQLGLAGLKYDPPRQVLVEPGWDPPADGVSGMNAQVTEVLRPKAVDRNRPPKAARMTEEAWAASRDEFCQRLLGLISDGEALVGQLQTIRTTAQPTEELAWRPKVDDWVEQFGAFANIYFNAFSTVPTGEKALLPRWRVKYVATVSGRVVWLREQRDQYGCAPVAR